MSVRPIYQPEDSPERRIGICIQHELDHGGSAAACAASVFHELHTGKIGGLQDLPESREEVARFIEYQFDGSRNYHCRRHKGHTHYGLQELRELMDFIYGGEPKTQAENIRGKD
jgi:hypothetical protein